MLIQRREVSNQHTDCTWTNWRCHSMDNTDDDDDDFHNALWYGTDGIWARVQRDVKCNIQFHEVFVSFLTKSMYKAQLAKQAW